MSELDIYKAQNMGNRVGFGRRAALLVVDFTVGFNDPKLFGGGNIDAAIKRTVGLLAFFREQKLPVAFTRVVYADDKSDAGVFAMKAPNLLMLTETHPAGQVVPELPPLPGEYMVRKTQASGFASGLLDVAAGLAALFLKSVAYQPEPFNWNPAADTSFPISALPQLGHSVMGASLSFWRYSFSNPQLRQRYS